MAASVVYPISLVLGPASAMWCYLADEESDRLVRLRTAAGVGGLIAAGTATVFAAHQLVLGRWDMSIEQQRWFGASINNPLSQLWRILVEQSTYMQVNGPGLARLLAIQTLLVLLLVATAAGVVLWRRGNRRLDPDDLGLLLLVGAMWALPLINTVQTGLYRREVALLPLVLLLRRAPTAVVVTFAVALIPVWALMADRFYHHILI
ncbi:MAG: hypothetical protein U5R31_09770 [Acidimicrobiia bacterium]|nr:hypothetical protein [Acidimicrobiia bacterium]